ncbi:phosphatase PAP2 family protein [Priestia megaterium]|uniref:phosphatase PAP2 family protein n=1 Tax=Priestia megaterium TaxID=1404 RepID=UPI0018A0E06A|nr:phosphatase PAP2 family protein [Priestia megaterium]
MNLKVQFTVVFILSAISIIGFGFLAILVSQDRIIHFDSTVISFMQGFESPILTSIMKFFTFIGSLPAIIVLSVLIMFFLYTVLKHRSELILFVAAILGSSVLFRILKQIFQRERPNLHRLIEISSYSFPSGHATNAFAFYGILAFLLWRHLPTRWGRTILILLSVIMILAVGTSRIYLGVHYPSDVLAGYLVSIFWLTIIIWLYQRYKEKIYNRKHLNDNQ